MSLYSDRADEILQAHSLSRTPGRIALLQLLAAQKRPVPMEFLKKSLSKRVDETTLYRSVDTFIAEGILVQFDFGHGHAHYELAHDKPHHHHAVCERCGRIEDIPAQDSRTLTTTTLKKAPSFASFNRHSLEFYGLCVSCAP